MKNSMTSKAIVILLMGSLTYRSASANTGQADRLTNSVKSRTVLFITGAFVSNTGWDEWKAYFEEKGFTTYAPPWPHKDASPEVLRSRHPDTALASLRFAELVDYFADFAAKLPEKPILIGHSTGGLIAQLLHQRGLGVAAIAYHSVPPKGVLTSKFSFIKAVTPAFGIFRSAKKTYMMSFKQWQYAFTNGMPLQDQKDSYQKNTVPESRRVARGAIGKAAKIDFKKRHPPLLFISGSDDHIMPASLNMKNYRKYKNKDSITDYKEFAGRNHFALGQPTWKEDADFMLTWIDKIEKDDFESPVTKH